jgi:predicted dehydrogenase
MFGTGFWARYQLAGWHEAGAVECVALYNRTIAKAAALAESAGLNVAIYDDPDRLLDREQIDFVDIVTHPATHLHLTRIAAARSLPIICQKPMALTLEAAEEMARLCEGAGVPLLINENWRWQAPIRRLKQLLDDGVIGKPYRARIRMVSSFPVFDNQPFLREQEQFLLLDIGPHILDTARFLFGEAQSIYCTIRRVQPWVKGEDVATVTLLCVSGASVICEMGYAGTPLEVDHFPQTFALIEGPCGSIELAPNYEIRVTTKNGTDRLLASPPRFAWADPCYDVVHASIVPCQANLLAGLRGLQQAETTAPDNLRTMRLVFAAYDSATGNEVIRL